VKQNKIVATSMRLARAYGLAIASQDGEHIHQRKWMGSAMASSNDVLNIRYM
jgi:hypothetical protein